MQDLQQLSSRMQPAPQSAAPAQSKLSRMQLAQRLASGESVEVRCQLIREFNLFAVLLNLTFHFSFLLL